MLIYGDFVEFFMQQRQPLKKRELTFRDLLFSTGCSERAVEELWKWYDFSKKKGVASF